jgi:hypothetical protein
MDKECTTNAPARLTAEQHSKLAMFLRILKEAAKKELHLSPKALPWP